MDSVIGALVCILGGVSSIATDWLFCGPLSSSIRSNICSIDQSLGS